MSDSAQIGVTGLAVMGSNLARNFARHGHAVAVHNRTDAKTRALIEEFGHEGTFLPSYSVEDFVASLERPRRIVIMVKAGGPTDAVIEGLAPLLEPGDILVDGGNAHFADTRRREAALREQGIHFVGTGISGGEEGALNGPSIMPGGTEGGVRVARPAAGVDLRPCRRHPVLHPRRRGRRRPLREDGAQRHRVRRHAADRRGVRPAPARAGDDAGRDRGRLPGLELRRPRVVPHRDHRRRARAHRRGDRQAVRRRRARPGRAEGHRPVDRADRARPRGAGQRDRRGGLRPLAVRARRAARGRPRPARPGRRRHGRPGRLRRRRPQGAVRVQGRRVRAGLRRDHRRRRRVRLGHRPRRDGDDLARRLHHPGPVPQPDQGGVRPRPAAAHAAGRRLLHRRGCGRAGVLATGGGHRRPGRRADPGLLLGAGLLRRAAGEAAAGCARAGPARPVRRAHLPPQPTGTASSTPAGRPTGRRSPATDRPAPVRRGQAAPRSGFAFGPASRAGCERRAAASTAGIGTLPVRRTRFHPTSRPRSAASAVE